MVHKSMLIPGLSKFIDESVLSQYAPTSMKRILGAGALSLFLNRHATSIDTIVNSLGLVNESGMLKLEVAKDILKNEIAKAGFMRIHFPILGDVDFTSEDVDKLYQNILDVDSQSTSVTSPPTPQPNLI